MNTKHRMIVLAVLLAMLLALPAAAFARKRVWTGQLTTGAELHEVVGSDARGSIAVGTNPDGSLRFALQVRGLTSAPTGAHLHGAATPEENAPVLLTLCGGPAPSVAGECVLIGGILTISGELDPMLLRGGVTPAEFFGFLEDDLLYVNVHTPLNPAGEARGQLIGR